MMGPTERPPPVPGLLSIVVPLCDEEESLAPLVGEILAVSGKLPEWKLELIFVDDGSRDDSWAKIRECAAADPRIHGIRFRRNFGKARKAEASHSRPAAWARGIGIAPLANAFGMTGSTASSASTGSISVLPPKTFVP